MKGFSLALLGACVLLLGAATAHKTPDVPKPRWGWDEPTVLRPGRVYTASVAESSAYAVAVNDGDAVAVQIERTSYRRVVAGESLPRVRVCHGRGGGNCAYESHNGTLSFAYTAAQARRYARPTAGAGRAVTFSLDRTTPGTSAAVAVMVCVGPNASLAQCRSACTLNCSHGAPSTLLNACVCAPGYTGVYCGQETTNYTRHDFDSEFADEIEFIAFIIAFVVWSVMAVLMAAFVVAMVAVVCVLFRACCCCGSSVHRGRVLGRRSTATAANSNQNSSSRPVPPPPYPAGAYHPLSVVPPPPPPPAPLPVPNNAVEMARFPASTPIYIVPPPAPVRDIPVYPQRPAPKN